MTKEAIYNYFYKLGCADAIKYAEPKEEFVGPPEPKGLASAQIYGMPSVKRKYDINRVIPRGVTDAAKAAYKHVGPFNNQAIISGTNRSEGAARGANPNFKLLNSYQQHPTKGVTLKGTWG